MTDNEELLSQLKNGFFKRMLFTIFNFIDDDGYLKEIRSKYKNVDIEDFEYFMFNISEEEKRALKFKRKSGYKNLSDFKHYIEKEVQDGIPELAIFLMNDKSAMIAVKLKSTDISKILN